MPGVAPDRELAVAGEPGLRNNAAPPGVGRVLAFQARFAGSALDDSFYLRSAMRPSGDPLR